MTLAGAKSAVTPPATSDTGAPRPTPITFALTTEPKGGLVVACPHSGRFYCDEMLRLARLDAFTLRRSEDAFVDLLFAEAPAQGADLVVNNFARAFVDVNRCASELDPALIDDVNHIGDHMTTDRVKAGLGVIPRTVGDGMNIYQGTLSLDVAQSRIAEVHGPWHRALETRLEISRQRSGIAVLLDCHSMPSSASGEPAMDIVIGDRFGSSCAPALTNEAVSCLRGLGFKVARNDPYAGGYSTLRHANLLEGRHALQVEINRSLYMVEGAMTPRAGFDDVAKAMTSLVSRLCEVSHSIRAPQPYFV